MQIDLKPKFLLKSTVSMIFYQVTHCISVQGHLWSIDDLEQIYSGYGYSRSRPQTGNFA